jgi:hypothetical protein
MRQKTAPETCAAAETAFGRLRSPGKSGESGTRTKQSKKILAAVLFAEEAVAQL